MSERSTEGSPQISECPPPWEAECNMKGCKRPASPRRTIQIYSESEGEKWPDDVSGRPVCNFHYVLHLPLGSGLTGVPPILVGLYAALTVPKGVDLLPWDVVESVFVMILVAGTVLFAQYALLLSASLVVNYTGGGRLAP